MKDLFLHFQNCLGGFFSWNLLEWTIQDYEKRYIVKDIVKCPTIIVRIFEPGKRADSYCWKAYYLANFFALFCGFPVNKTIIEAKIFFYYCRRVSLSQKPIKTDPTTVIWTPFVASSSLEAKWMRNRPFQFESHIFI